eukprot:TRINITY_DN3690_c0_g1_i2.p1 TRINITY_DN3690_c0_g1~~TRINITY_DN3690_c0_g1_i2.p1  ORF type:complete len:1123 (+),score=311.18 TRINITY_DN3690_c0_g1_i2:2-3370(+)
MAQTSRHSASEVPVEPLELPKAIAIKHGFLFKQGPRLLDHHAAPMFWNKRWMCLEDTQLLYYENSTEASQQGKPVRMSEITSIARVVLSDQKFCFKLVGDVRTTYLAAETEEDMLDWMRAITAVWRISTHPEKTAAGGVSWASASVAKQTIATAQQLMVGIKRWMHSLPPSPMLAEILALGVRASNHTLRLAAAIYFPLHPQTTTRNPQDQVNALFWVQDDDVERNVEALQRAGDAIVGFFATRPNPQASNAAQLDTFWTQAPVTSMNEISAKASSLARLGLSLIPSRDQSALWLYRPPTIVEDIDDPIRAQHDHFSSTRVTGVYLGLRTYEATAFGYLENTQPSTRSPALFICGSSGCGKSSLVSVIHTKLRAETDKTDRLVIAHFTACSLDTADLRLSLLRWTNEIVKRFPQAWPYPVPADLRELCNAFPVVLKSASAFGQIVMLIDDIDMLSVDETSSLGVGSVPPTHELRWLPPVLPPNCALIASLNEDSLTFRTVRLRGAPLLKIRSLSSLERTQFIQQFSEISSIDIKLSLAAQSELSNSRKTRIPFYLMTILNDIRLFQQYRRAVFPTQKDITKTTSERLAVLLSTVDESALCDAIINELVTNFSENYAILDALALACSARNGISAMEFLYHAKQPKSVPIGHIETSEDIRDIAKEVKEFFAEVPEATDAPNLPLFEQLVCAWLPMSKEAQISHFKKHWKLLQRLSSIFVILNGNLFVSHSLFKKLILSRFETDQKKQYFYSKLARFSMFLFDTADSKLVPARSLCRYLFLAQNFLRLHEVLSDEKTFLLMCSSHESNYELHIYVRMLAKHSHSLDSQFLNLSSAKFPLDTLLSLAKFFQEQYNFVGAKTLLEQALSQIEYEQQHSRPEDDKPQPSMETLASVLCQLGMLLSQLDEKSGLIFFQRALSTAETHLQSPNAVLALVQEQAAEALARQAPEKATQLMAKLVASATAVHGASHFLLGDLHRKTARILMSQAKFLDAEKALTEAKTVYESSLQGDHPKVAAALQDLGLLYKNLGRYEDSKKAYQVALTIYEDALGPSHDAVALCYLSLALLYESSSMAADAVYNAKQARAILLTDEGDSDAELKVLLAAALKPNSQKLRRSLLYTHTFLL